MLEDDMILFNAKIFYNVNKWGLFYRQWLKANTGMYCILYSRSLFHIYIMTTTGLAD